MLYQDASTVVTYLLHIYIYISYTSSKTNMLNPKPGSFGSDDFPEFKKVKISGLFRDGSDG